MTSETYKNVTSIVRSLKKAGCEPTSVEMRPDGTITVLTKSGPYSSYEFLTANAQPGETVWLDEVGDHGKKKGPRRA
jgi:hypothetical protein